MPTAETLCILKCKQAFKQATSEKRKKSYGGGPIGDAAWRMYLNQQNITQSNCVRGCMGSARIYAGEIGSFFGLSSTTVLMAGGAAAIFLVLIMARKLQTKIS